MFRLHFTAAQLFARGAASFAPPSYSTRYFVGADDFLVLDHTCLRGDAQHACEERPGGAAEQRRRRWFPPFLATAEQAARKVSGIKQQSEAEQAQGRGHRDIACDDDGGTGNDCTIPQDPATIKQAREIGWGYPQVSSLRSL